MKLCRFELTEAPEKIRSGLFHEGRFYETDGNQALGIHDVGKLRLLAPIGHPPTLRYFDADGGYHYANTALILGPLADFEVPEGVHATNFSFRLGFVLGDSGLQVDRDEAMSFILGMTTIVEFLLGDVPCAVGPFLQTLEDFPEINPNEFPQWEWSVAVNQVPASSGIFESPLHPCEAIQICSKTNAVQSGDLIGLPTVTAGPSQSLLPGDTLKVHFSRLDPLIIKIV